MLEKLIKDLKQTREDLETTDKEWKKKVNTSTSVNMVRFDDDDEKPIIRQNLAPILPVRAHGLRWLMKAAHATISIARDTSTMTTCATKMIIHTVIRRASQGTL